jgi:aspartyl-tRNA(Asn)/glutamyl-tRNA(Gln) amidotransferase subunit A
MSLTDLTIIELRDRIASGDTRSVEAVEAAFSQIDRIEPTVGAFVSLFREEAIQRAREIDHRKAAGERLGKLAGVPVAVKDNMCTKVGTTTCGSRILQNFHSPYEATAVRKLLEADAVIIGKANMDEFAMGSSTENSGLKKTANPRFCSAALGSDTGGSIRQPASFCGIVGLKPTYGRVSRYGLVAFGSSLDQIGPMARSVADAALMLGIVAGHDPADSTSVSESMAPVPDYLARLDEPVKGLKIGVASKFNAGAEPAVRHAIEAAAQTYRTMGAEIVEIALPHFDYAIAAYYVIATAEASSNLARYDGVHYGYRTAHPADYIEVYSKSREEAFGKEVKRRIMLGTYALSSGYYDAYYLKALKVRNLIRGDLVHSFEQCDAIAMPVAPTTAFKIGEKTDDPLKMYLSDIYTISVNLAGIPGISLPCGFDENGLPIGLQLLAPAFTEDKLLRIARMFEAATDWHTKKPAIVG